MQCMRTFDIDIMDLYLPGGEQGTPKKNKPYSSVVQFDQFPGASWAGFWAPKALPGGEQGTPRNTNPTVQLFNLMNCICQGESREPQEKQTLQFS